MELFAPAVPVERTGDRFAVSDMTSPDNLALRIPRVRYGPGPDGGVAKAPEIYGDAVAPQHRSGWRCVVSGLCRAREEHVTPFVDTNHVALLIGLKGQLSWQCIGRVPHRHSFVRAPLCLPRNLS